MKWSWIILIHISIKWYTRLSLENGYCISLGIQTHLMSLRSQSRKLTVIIHNEMINQKQLSYSVVRELFCTMHK